MKHLVLSAAIVALGLFDASPCRAQWTELEAIADSVLNRWGEIVADDDAWNSTSSYTNPLTDSTWTINCNEVRTAVGLALSEDDWYWGTHPWAQGEHTDDHEIYLNQAFHADDREIFETAMHESMHHVGQRHGWAGHWEREHYRAIAGCHDYAREEEEDDPNEGGGEPTEPVCEEKLVAVYYTVYEREYRAGSPCLASDDIDNATWCHGVGTWVLVAKQKVKWETQTVCSS